MEPLMFKPANRKHDWDEELDLSKPPSDEVLEGQRSDQNPTNHTAPWALKIYEGQDVCRLTTMLLTHEATSDALVNNHSSIEHELHRVLSSATFRRSNRLRKMLEYVMAKFLTGQCDLLKEYTIGLEVFDRGTSFDPTSDPIVRVEASRLRHKLSWYYSSEGKTSPFRIELPKGTYSPVICEAAAQSASNLQWLRTTAKGIIVLPFLLWENANHATKSQTLIISDQLIYRLTKTSRFRVLSRFATLKAAPEMDAKELGRHFDARFIVEGSVRITEQECSIFTHLVDAEHSSNLWSGRYRTSIEGLASVADSISSDVIGYLDTNYPEILDKDAHEIGAVDL